MLYMQYNFYDYDTDHPELSAFDVHQCYTPEQTDELVIVFPGKILHTGACGLCGLVGKVNWLKKSFSIFSISTTVKCKASIFFSHHLRKVSLQDRNVAFVI